MIPCDLQNLVFARDLGHICPQRQGKIETLFPGALQDLVLA